MTVPELVAYVRQQSQAGVSAQELRETLMEAGWSERDVENALHDVAAGLRPVTSGASIHEDLAQVRGLVAHLTARVGRLEARLINAGEPMLTEPGELSSGALGPERAIQAPRTGWRGIAVGTLIVFTVCAGAGSYLTAATPESAPRILIATGSIAVLFALFSWFFIRRRRTWPARFAAATTVALGAWSNWLAWNSYQLLEWTTALAIAVLLVVYLGVVARWIRRIER